jgi:hypothetical protein
LTLENLFTHKPENHAVRNLLALPDGSIWGATQDGAFLWSKGQEQILDFRNSTSNVRGFLRRPSGFSHLHQLYLPAPYTPSYSGTQLMSLGLIFFTVVLVAVGIFILLKAGRP